MFMHACMHASQSVRVFVNTFRFENGLLGRRKTGSRLTSEGGIQGGSGGTGGRRGVRNKGSHYFEAKKWIWMRREYHFRLPAGVSLGG